VLSKRSKNKKKDKSRAEEKNTYSQIELFPKSDLLLLYYWLTLGSYKNSFELETSPPAPLLNSPPSILALK